jgi:hypothetical protein
MASARRRFYAGRRLTPCPAYIPNHRRRGAAETAGADGLNIAETFPEGRGSPHGCGLRAVFCTDAASARPEACRDKSKAPRSGDVAGRSPGVQGGGDWPPLCAPCARRGITQKTNRERHLPGITQNNRFSGRNHCKPITLSNYPAPAVSRPVKRSAAGRSGPYLRRCRMAA